MKYVVLIDDRLHEVEIVEEGGCERILWDGKPVEIDGQLDQTNPSRSLIIDGRPYEVEWQKDGSVVRVGFNRAVYDVRVSRGLRGREKAILRAGGSGEETVQAPMPGMVVTVKVQPNQEVKIGEPLLILEAMKMENELRSPVNGRIQKIWVETGKKVEKGEKLLVLKT